MDHDAPRQGRPSACDAVRTSPVERRPPSASVLFPVLFCFSPSTSPVVLVSAAAHTGGRGERTKNTQKAARKTPKKQTARRPREGTSRGAAVLAAAPSTPPPPPPTACPHQPSPGMHSHCPPSAHPPPTGQRGGDREDAGATNEQQKGRREGRGRGKAKRPGGATKEDDERRARERAQAPRAASAPPPARAPLRTRRRREGATATRGTPRVRVNKPQHAQPLARRAAGGVGWRARQRHDDIHTHPSTYAPRAHKGLKRFTAGDCSGTDDKARAAGVDQKKKGEGDHSRRTK